MQAVNHIRRFCDNIMHIDPKLSSLQFVSALLKLERFKKGALIVWVDFTKFGRVCNNDLNDTLDVLQTTISRLPERACAFIVGPHLISEKVQNGLRGEIRIGWGLNVKTFVTLLVFKKVYCKPCHASS